MPAFLTAVEIAFTAVEIAFISCVRSPLADGYLRCSASRKRVSVMQSVSIPAPVVVMVVTMRVSLDDGSAQVDVFCKIKVHKIFSYNWSILHD